MLDPSQSARARDVALLVDDEETSRESLAELLQSLGYDTLTADNGQSALVVLKQPGPKPAVILLDLMMPVMNGWQFLEVRSRDEELRRIPVIVISAALDASAQLPGVIGYLRKPVSDEGLVALLERVKSGQEAPTTVEPAPTPGRKLAPGAVLRVLLIQESDASAAVTTGMLNQGTEFPFDVRRVHALSEALTRDALDGVDVILLDVVLSDEAGLAALQKVLRRAPGVPVVALISDGLSEGRSAMIRSGAQDAVARGSQTSELLGRTLHHAFERAHLRSELERTSELAAHERERRRLKLISTPRSAIAAEMLGHVPLKVASPGGFASFVKEFVTICERAVTEREHELESSVQRKELQRLSDALAALRVGPGDLVDIYQSALTTAWTNDVSELDAARREEARLMLIGSLGYVLAAYRLYVGTDSTSSS